MTTITELPKDGQKVEFKLSEHGPWINGIYNAKTLQFVSRNSDGKIFYFSHFRTSAWRPRKEGEDA